MPQLWTPRPRAQSSYSLALPILVLGLASSWSWVAAGRADDPAPTATPTVTTVRPTEDLSPERRGVRIGAIEIVVSDVFDPSQPEENRRFYRAANKLHIDTRKRVIERQLLFKSGDRFERRLLDETERLLRADRYLYDATIEVARDHGDTVDLVVKTRDVWTLKVGLGLGRSGGVNTSHFELEEYNLFGTGKGVTLNREVGIDRTSTEVRYDDHHLFGSHAQLTASFKDNSDGDQRYLKLERPFFSLNTSWAAGGLALEENRVDSLYRLGRISDQFRHRQRWYELSTGRSPGLVDGWTNRYSLGFTFRQDRFESLSGGSPTAMLPEDRTLVYPWVSFDRVQDRFVEERDLDQIHRTEDVQLGRELHLRLGLATEATGSDRTAAVFEGSASAGFKPSPRQTLTTGASAAGRWGEEGGEDILLSAVGRYYLRNFDDQLFFATLEVAAADQLDTEHQLLLGGDNGLRGYPLRYQEGDRRLLLTLEQRYFSRYQPFRLLNIGAAVFYDLGRTWGDERQFGRNFGWLQDVGLGLRLASSRSHSGSVLHIDVAFPLGGGSDVESMQYLVTTKTRF